MADTPNMNLALPVVQETLGPTYAQMNNEAFEDIDSHDHTNGKGVQVPTAGININLDLPMNGFAVTEANALSLVDVVGTPEELSVYSDSGDLYFRNASGTAVQITTGNTIVGTVGAISGLGDGGSSASFSDVSEDFSWFYEGARLAAFNVGDIRLYPFDGLNSPAGTTYTNFITLKSPTTLVSDYELTLPTDLPASSSRLVQVDSTGQLSYTNTVAESLTLSSPVIGSVGSEASPSYSFSGDSDTGIFRRTSDCVSITTGGTQRFEIRSTAVVADVPVQASSGTAAAPSFSFTVDSDTGMYRSGSNSLSFATAGSQRLEIGTSAIESLVEFRTPALNLNGGGAFKVKVISCGTTGTLAAGGGFGVAIAAHGLTETNVRSVSAYARSGSAGFGSGSTHNGGYVDVQAYVDSSDVTVRVINNLGVSANWTCYAVITYV